MLDQHLSDIINKAQKVVGCRTSYRVQKFSNAVISKECGGKGVYAIFEGSIIGKGPVIYVGKGNIAKRIASHKRKARKDLAPPKYIPEGWKWLMEHKEYDIEDWELFYQPMESHVEMTALEGILIKEFKPIANDETFHDRTLIQEVGN